MASEANTLSTELQPHTDSILPVTPQEDPCLKGPVQRAGYNSRLSGIDLTFDTFKESYVVVDGNGIA